MRLSIEAGGTVSIFSLSTSFLRRQHFPQFIQIILARKNFFSCLFASLLAYVKLEKLKFAHKLNHFALKAKLYFAALKMAWMQLDEIKKYHGA